MLHRDVASGMAYLESKNLVHRYAFHRNATMNPHLPVTVLAVGCECPVEVCGYNALSGVVESQQMLSMHHLVHLSLLGIILVNYVSTSQQPISSTPSAHKLLQNVLRHWPAYLVWVHSIFIGISMSDGVLSFSMLFLLHRDLAARNVLVSTESKAKVTHLHSVSNW